MGIGSSGGGFAGNRGGGGGSGFGGNRGGNNAWESGGSASGGSRKEAEGGVNLDTEAPIPGEPQLYSEGDVFHVARVTFTVKLVDETTADSGV